MPQTRLNDDVLRLQVGRQTAENRTAHARGGKTHNITAHRSKQRYRTRTGAHWAEQQEKAAWSLRRMLPSSHYQPMADVVVKPRKSL